ncbi:C4-dicarboxylate transporter DctA [Burkholderia stagnalis]
MTLLRPLRLLYVQVLIAMALGVALGHAFPHAGVALKPLGDAFIALVRMMVAPIVFCTIVTGINAASDGARIGRTIVKALALFYALTAAALAAGLVIAYAARPGDGLHVAARQLDASALASFTAHAPPTGVASFLLQIIPDTLVGAFAGGDVLPVLLVGLLFGFALAASERRDGVVHAFVEGIARVLFRVLALVMRLAPLGAFGAIAFAVGRFGIDSLGSLGRLIVAMYVACALFVMLVLAPLARLHGFSLWRLLRYLREELLIVLATSSTEPVLPRLLVKLEALGCDKGVVGLVLPAGYSFNLDGTAIYLTLAATFIAQACDVPLSAAQVATLLAVMLITSKGAAGVSGSGLVALIATLTVVPDLPVAGVALLVGIDRFMSEARALTSVISNACAVVVVSIWQRGCDRARLRAMLDPDARRPGTMQRHNEALDDRG